MFKRRRRKKILRHREIFKERTWLPQRGFSCAVGAGVAIMVEEQNDIGYLMAMEIMRPHASPGHSHRVIAPSQMAFM